MALVFLIYGLAFFILGFAIVVYPKKQSNFALARSVWLIAAFGILHGLNEWVDMFIIIERPSGLSFLYTMRSFLLPASFIALLQFGIGGIVTGKKRSRHLLRTLPAVLLILWSSAVFKSSDHVLAADVWARYLLCVPGTALTSLVLMRQSAEIADLGLSRPKTYLMLSALGFLFYGFLSGLIVPDAGFFPASLLNYTMFEKTAGLKVQIFRTACALVVTFNMIKVLEIFELEAVESLRRSRDELEMKVRERTKNLEREIDWRRRIEEELRALSLTDELTGLCNRRGFFNLVEQELKMAARLKREVFMLYADLDNLKTINDTFGHSEGDQALIGTAKILRETFRDCDIVARIGGDEFMVLQIGITGDNMEAVAARLQTGIETYNEQREHNYRLSLSFGVSYYDPENPCSVDELLHRGEKMMYEQKMLKRFA